MNGAELQLAVMRVGQVWIGVNLDQVVHAMPAAGTLGILPQHSGALVGIVEYENQIIPVVDLYKWVNVGSTSDLTMGAQRIAILKSVHGAIALRVDAVHGITKVPSSSIQRIEHSDSGDEVFNSVVKAEELGQVLCLLEVSKLCALACAWNAATTEQHVVQNETSVPPTVDSSLPALCPQAYAMFDLETTTLAIPAGFVAEVIPMPPVQSFPSRAFTGLCEWRNRKVLVLNINNMLSQEPAKDSYSLLALLTHDEHTVALPVKAVRQIDVVDSRQVQTGDNLVQVRYNEQGQPVHMLDASALFSRYPEIELSKVENQASPNLSNGLTGKYPIDSNGEAYIAYEADGLCAIAVSFVEEVLPYLPTTKTGGFDSKAVLNWRGKSVDTYDLRKNLTVPTTTSGVVLIVRLETRFVALVVKQVSALIAPGSASLFRMTLGKQGVVSVLTTGEGPFKTSYVVKEPARLVQ